MNRRTMMFEFKLADKTQIEQQLPELFRILHSNMSLIAPTNNSYEYDFEIWSSHIIPAIQKGQRRFIEAVRLLLHIRHRRMLH